MVSCVPRRLVGTSKRAQLELACNRAVCLYRLKHYGPEILEHGVRQYPELSIGSHAAIDYVNGNLGAAKENLTDMPPRAEEELGSVTLHNQALMNMEVDPTAGFRKLNFLLQNPPFPSETLANLLLLYCKPSHGFYDLAADVMAEHVEVIFKYPSQDLYDFINCIILTKTSPEDAYQKMNELANRYSETMRRLTKQIQDSCLSRDQEGHKKALAEYEDSLENEVAEDLMRKIEEEEERAHYENPDKQELHLCIVNLVIGTLYCAKKNFEFGISHIIRSLEPYGKKLEADTLVIVLNDATYADIDDFLDAADSQGKIVYTSVESPRGGQNSNTVSREARLLKRMFLKIRECGRHGLQALVLQKLQVEPFV
ncbi:hypothetical protein SELMODRAFT_446703 [Selaginella moellendorffii]|uniref:Uncharacterized protein n=1 Tax=Selaginella moellendorffii TaxID=88036 RepID=D8STM6_SELML|nr:hypothetical protein SELMODRAFT_446703 [Selaginella moellendorffii]